MEEINEKKQINLRDWAKNNKYWLVVLAEDLVCLSDF